MATATEFGRTGYDDWIQLPAKSAASRFFTGLKTFARRKPLGALCGLVVLFFMIIGDIVPETANKVTSIAGLERPVPYVADALESKLSWVFPYDQQHLRDRLQSPSSTY